MVAYRSSADANAYLSLWQSGLKGGYWQLIHSMSVDYNSTNVVQLTPYLNMFCSYKALTTWSLGDQAKYGAVTGFFKDNSDSIVYNNTQTTANGGGVSNNLVQTPGAAGIIRSFAATNSVAGQQAEIAFCANDGYVARLSNSTFYPIAAAGGINDNDLYSLLSSDNASNSALPQLRRTGGADATRTWWKQYVAVIRLKDIADFFDKMPLVKGAYLKFTINYNAGTCSILTANNNDRMGLTATPTLTAGSTIPFMVSSSAPNNPMVGYAAVAAGVQTWTYASNVNRATPSGGVEAVHSVFNSCRLYVPLYTMNPIYEEQYVSMSPTKEVIYRDIYQYTINNISSGGSTNSLLTNGISSPKSLVVIPFINSAVGVFQAGIVNSSLTSPFSAGPNQTDPLCSLTNLNVQLSGINLFQQNISYGFEEFQNEVCRINAVNGGQTTGLTSGLLNSKDWERAHRYYVVDLSRGYKADDNIPKSVLLTALNNSAKALDLYCFIEYERKLTISVQSGAIVQV